MDLKKLLFATLNIYKEAVVESVMTAVSSWRMLGFQFLIILASAVMLPLSNLVPPPASGFAMGLALAYLLSCYLVTIKYSLDEKGNPKLKYLVGEANQLFGPVISILFAFFILSFLLKSLVQVQNGQVLFACIQLLLAVFFNPLPEILQSRPGFLTAMAGESYEFVLENFIEWFAPTFLVLGLLALISLSFSMELTLVLFTTSPLALIESFIMMSSLQLLSPVSLITLCVSIPLLFVIFLFRLTLYRRLSTSTRRKRIYQYSGVS